MSVDLTPLRALAIALAGGGAGFINAIVGSGTLISFPTIVGVGFDKLAANVANNIGLFPGSLSASWGFRRELAGQRHRLLRLTPMSGLGALIGSLLLFVLPSSYFKRIVPFLILTGVFLVLAQPRLQVTMRARQARQRAAGTLAPVDLNREHIGLGLQIGVFLAGIYGGYFGAAQGVILMAFLGIALTDDLTRLNATKNVLATVVNGTAALVFVIRGDVPWAAGGLVAVGSVCGALIGAHVGRRISPNLLRGVIVVVGTFVAVRMLISS